MYMLASDLVTFTGPIYTPYGKKSAEISREHFNTLLTMVYKYVWGRKSRAPYS